MPRIFVDCDDTLVLWNTTVTPTGVYLTDGYVLNQELARNVNSFLLAHPDYDLVVWSGGGPDYAARWARMFKWVVEPSIVPKWMRAPGPGDIVVDDMELGTVKGVINKLPGEMKYCPVCREEE